MRKDPEATSPTLDRLLDTAAELFWNKGYPATTTREIAAALNIQQASLYYYMKSKEDLLYHLCISSLGQFLADVPAALEGSPDRIRALIRTHVITLLRNQKRSVTMLTELRSLTPRHRTEVVALREQYGKFVTHELEAAQREGSLRADISASHLTLALLNLLNWSVLWFREGRSLSPEALADLFLDIFLHGVAKPGGARLPVPDLTPQRKPAARGRKTKTAETSTIDRLLEAAVALFAKQGYDPTSTREVAALLGMQKASLYYHIQGKEDLLYLICRSSLERIRSDVATVVRGIPDPLERTRALMCAHIESMLRDRDEHSTTLAEMHALSKDRLALVVELRDAYEALVRSVLQEAQQAGALRDDIGAKFLCLSLLGFLNRVLVWYRPKGPLTPAQIGELLSVIFLFGAAA